MLHSFRFFFSSLICFFQTLPFRIIRLNFPNLLHLFVCFILFIKNYFFSINFSFSLFNLFLYLLHVFQFLLITFYFRFIFLHHCDVPLLVVFSLFSRCDYSTSLSISFYNTPIQYIIQVEIQNYFTPTSIKSPDLGAPIQ